MAEMKNYTDEEMENLGNPLKDDADKLLEKFLCEVPLGDIPKQYRIEEAKRRRKLGINPWIKPET